jgi:hypothetical protein
MKRISVYLKLRVVGAIETAPGNTIVSRIRQVAERTFHDEEGVPHVFTWRTIQTWYSLYAQHGVDALRSRPRNDKGQLRKVSPELLRVPRPAKQSGFKKPHSKTSTAFSPNPTGEPNVTCPPADHPRIRRCIATTHQGHFKNKHSTIINLKSKNEATPSQKNYDTHGTNLRPHRGNPPGFTPRQFGNRLRY